MAVDFRSSFEGISPSSFMQSSESKTIHYGIHPGPFGPYLVGMTDLQRICLLHFLDRRKEVSHYFKGLWQESRKNHCPEMTEDIASVLFNPGTGASIPLLAVGTPFQLKVWKYLVTIPFGEKVFYRQVAEATGSPLAFQAVGNAIGNNHIAYLIPCHRVVRKDGKPTRYRWGNRLKEEMLRWESHRW